MSKKLIALFLATLLSSNTVFAQAINNGGSGGGGGSGTVGSCSSGNIAYYASTGTTVGCLSIGTGLTLTGGTLSSTGGFSGGTLTSELITQTSGTANAPLNIPPGSAPTSPVNGDVWTTSLGVYSQVNGATVGPFGTGGSGSSNLGSSASATSPQISGSPGNGFYTAGAGLVDVGIGSSNLVQWSSSGEVITAASSTAFVVGANGSTAPALSVDTSPSSPVSGVNIKPGATGVGAKITGMSSDTSGAGLNLTIGGGSATATGLGGATVITSGSSLGTSSGAITIQPAQTSTGTTPGNLNLLAGLAQAGGGGSIFVTASNSVLANDAGGGINIATGSGLSSGGNSRGGSLGLTTGNAGTSGNGGGFTLVTGNAAGGIGGTALMTTGNGGGANPGGSFGVTTGNGGATGAGGTLTFTSGNGGSTSGASGNVVFATGTVVSGTKGTVNINADMVFGGAAPTGISCGGGAIATGSTDHKGQITGVTAATSCTFNFSQALGAAPSCSLSGTAVLAGLTTGVTTTAPTWGMTAYTGTLYYICF